MVLTHVMVTTIFEGLLNVTRNSGIFFAPRLITFLILKFSLLNEKHEKHFLKRLTNFDLPYTIRLISLNY